MMRESGYTFILLLFLASLLIIPTICADTQPTISVDPLHPKPKGNVTFIATIPNSNITDNVVIFVEECASEVCYGDHFNQSMTKNDTGIYQTTITLRHENTVEMKYRIGYLTSNGWIWYPNDVNNLIAVSLDTSNHEDGGGNDNGSSDSPGFQAPGVLATVILISFVLYSRRK